MMHSYIFELRIAMVILAPLQWASVLWYVRRLGQFPNHLAKRMIPWAALVALNVVVPLTVLLLNRRGEEPDPFLMITGFAEGTVFVLLLLYLLRKRTNPR